MEDVADCDQVVEIVASEGSEYAVLEGQVSHRYPPKFVDFALQDC